MAEQDLNKPFAERRAAARARAGALQADFEADDQPLGWFEALYAAAGDDEAQVPWADLEAHPGLAWWIAKSGVLHEGRAIDIGCGLGDNAEALSDAGYDVTAFDVSARAVEWAGQRFPGTRVQYRRADLFDLPREWLGAFDLVHECYTVQALKNPHRLAAFTAVSSLVASGGTLLVICRSRPEDAGVDGPPWPLSRNELDGFCRHGVRLHHVEAFDVVEERVIPHFRALYVRDD